MFSGGTVNYYVDGQQAGVQTAIDATPPVGFTGLFQIGAGSPAADWGFPGKIDEVAIYNTALSPARIAAHYSSVAMTFDIHNIEFIDPTNLTPVAVTLSAPSGQSSSGLELTFSFDPAIITVTADIPGYGVVTIAPGMPSACP